MNRLATVAVLALLLPAFYQRPGPLPDIPFELVTGAVTIILCPEPAIIFFSCKTPASMYSAHNLTLVSAAGMRTAIPLNPDGTFSAALVDDVYSTGIAPCDFLGCNFPRPTSIAVSANSTHFDICFNCVLR